MSADFLYTITCWTIIGLAVVTFFVLFYVPAPYGRHRRKGWGPGMDSQWGWVVQESPSVLVFALVFFAGERSWQAVPLVLFLLWQAHYVQRTFFFPFLMRFKGTTCPILTVALAIFFNLMNASTNLKISV